MKKAFVDGARVRFVGTLSHGTLISKRGSPAYLGEGFYRVRADGGREIVSSEDDLELAPLPVHVTCEQTEGVIGWIYRLRATSLEKARECDLFKQFHTGRMIYISDEGCMATIKKVYADGTALISLPREERVKP